LKPKHNINSSATIIGTKVSHLLILGLLHFLYAQIMP
jgi:hypothetical protein